MNKKEAINIVNQNTQANIILHNSDTLFSNINNRIPNVWWLTVREPNLYIAFHIVLVDNDKLLILNIPKNIFQLVPEFNFQEGMIRIDLHICSDRSREEKFMHDKRPRGSQHDFSQYLQETITIP